MNFLHRFLPQPCFDNAGSSSGSAGGPGGVNRTATGARSTGIGMQSGGGYKEKAQGIPGFGTPQEGRAMNNAASAASRGGGGAGGGRGAPAATVTVAPPTRAYTPPAPPPAPMPTPAVVAPPAIATPAAPVSMAPAAYGPAAIGSAPMSQSQVASLAASNAASAPTRGNVSWGGSMSTTRSNPVSNNIDGPNAIGTSAARGIGQSVSATPSGGGRAGGVGTPGVGGGFGPSVSNAAAKSDRGIPSAGSINSRDMDDIGRLGDMASSAPAGAINSRDMNDIARLGQSVAKSSVDRGFNPLQGDFAFSQIGNPFGVGKGPLSSINSAAERALSGTQITANASPSSTFSKTAPVGRPAVGVPSTLARALSGPVATDPYSGLIPSSKIQSRISGLPASAPAQAVPSPSGNSPSGLSTSLGAIRDHLDFGYSPSATKAQAPDTRTGSYDFYSSDNSYQGVNFPSVNDAYPTSAAALPGGYSSTPQGSWSRNAPSFDTPMEAAQNMGLMDQMRAANMFTRGSVAPARNDGTNRGGNSKSNTKERNRAKKAIAEAIAPKKSGWSPYTGESRFANWTPIMKALIG